MPKQCGSCTLCCKLPRIPELNKELNQWCKHCAIGQGCKIYEDRPQVCRDYECLWLQSPDSTMGDDLRPDRTHVIFGATREPDVLQAIVDPNYPNALDKPHVRKLIQSLNRAGIGIIAMMGNMRTIIAEPNQAASIILRAKGNLD